VPSHHFLQKSSPKPTAHIHNGNGHIWRSSKIRNFDMWSVEDGIMKATPYQAPRRKPKRSNFVFYSLFAIIAVAFLKLNTDYYRLEKRLSSYPPQFAPMGGQPEMKNKQIKESPRRELPSHDMLEGDPTIPSSSGKYIQTDTCIITISAWNNFGFVQAFFSAVMKSNPNITCRVWFVADVPTYPPKIRDLPAEPPFDIVTLSELAALSSFSIEELAFRFDLVEFSTAVKPLAFLYMFKVREAELVLYFDNDCWVTGDLSDLIYNLQSRSVIVTPHTSTPIPEDGLEQRDLAILKAGVLNFGFVGFRNTPGSVSFISWWYERLRYYGYVALERGMHFDQNWGHFIFVFFNHDEYYVIRDPRYNIAYWNLHYTGNLASIDCCIHPSPFDDRQWVAPGEWDPLPS
jgi:hypothetical protein